MRLGWKSLRGAIALGHLSKLATKRLVISDEGVAHGAGGSAFSPEEMLAIRDCMSDVWVNDSVIPMTREGRHLSRALISLMSSTGITPGLEVETLTQSQIEFRDDTNERPTLRVAIRKNQGKRVDDRVVWARDHDVAPVLTDMRALLAWIAANATDEYRQNNPMGYLFCRPSDPQFPRITEAFAVVLEALGIRRNPVSGVSQTMYSCRHCFSIQSLLDDDRRDHGEFRTDDPRYLCACDHRSAERSVDRIRSAGLPDGCGLIALASQRDIGSAGYAA